MKKSTIVRKFGQRVRELRKAKGWSQEKLAERAGLNWKFIGLVETGKSDLTLKSVEKIATGLDIPIAHFFIFGPSRALSQTAESLVAAVLPVLKDDVLSEAAKEILKQLKKVRG